MIGPGLVLVAHGRLAHEFLGVLKQILGPVDGISTIGVDPSDDLEERARAVEQAIEASDVGLGVLILTDLFGGTPANLASRFVAKGRVEVLSGLNLPMLLKVVRLREALPLEALALEGQQAAVKYIHIASQVLQQE